MLGSPPAWAAVDAVRSRPIATGGPRWTGSRTSTAGWDRDTGGRHDHRAAGVRHAPARVGRARHRDAPAEPLPPARLAGRVVAPPLRLRPPHGPRRARGGQAHRRAAAVRGAAARGARRAVPRRRRRRTRRRPAGGRCGPVDGRAAARAGGRRRPRLRRPLRAPGGEPARTRRGHGAPQAGRPHRGAGDGPRRRLGHGVPRQDVGQAAQPAWPAAAPTGALRRRDLRRRPRPRGARSRSRGGVPAALHAGATGRRPRASPPPAGAGSTARRSRRWRRSGSRGSHCCGSPAPPSPATTSSCSTAACTSTSWRSTRRSLAGRRARSPRSRRSAPRRRRVRGVSSSSGAPSATSSSWPTG